MIYLNDDIAQIDVERWLPMLSEQRRQRVMAYRHELGRRTSLAAYLLLCEGLQREYGIGEPPVFDLGEHGKPAIVGHDDICFNMSHCCGAVLCAIDRWPIGADIEMVRTWNDRLAHYTMSDEELATACRSGQRDVVLTRLWTMKEALQKRLGEGLRSDMTKVLCGAVGVESAACESRGYVYSVAFDPRSSLRSGEGQSLEQQVIKVKIQ